MCKLFTPFMRCESNLKVKVDRKQGNLIAYLWSRVLRIRNTVKREMKTFFVSQKLSMLDGITHRFINSCRYVMFAEKIIKFDQMSINKYNLLVVKVAY